MTCSFSAETHKLQQYRTTLGSTPHGKRCKQFQRDPPSMDFFGSLPGSSFAALVLWMFILSRKKTGRSLVSIFHKRYPAQKLKQSVWPTCLSLLPSHAPGKGKLSPGTSLLCLPMLILRCSHATQNKVDGKRRVLPFSFYQGQPFSKIISQFI